MCILFVYTNPNPIQGKYQLIIATNRDEYYARPAGCAHQWPEDNFVIGGKDLEPGREGGTWFGISLRKTNQFKFRAAALLNVTGEPRLTGAAGRGSIVTDYLQSDFTAEQYIERLKPRAKTFNAFSFVAVELNDNIPHMYHYTNVTNSLTSYLNPNEFVIGFGNSLLHEPLNKVIAGQQRFQNIILHDNHSEQDKLVQELLQLLRWEKKHLPDPVLEVRAPTMMEHLSRVFVNVEEAGYGTRTHTLVLVDLAGNMQFVEDTLVDKKWTRSEFKAEL